MSIKLWSTKSERVLCKPSELASPHFHFVAIVDNVVVRLEAAMVEILELVDAGIAVIGEGYSYNRSERIRERGNRQHGPLPATPIPELSAVIWFHKVSGHDVSEIQMKSTNGFFRPTSYDLDVSGVASLDHGFVLRPGTTLGCEIVWNGLIIRPPLEALDVLLRRAH
jgi:hypothetical protein